MSEWQPLEAGTVVRDRYEVEALLGKGGFGATYRARDRERFDQPCALKELLPARATNPKVLELFEREARILLALRHPGIPSLHAYFTESSRYYLVQDFVAGATLAQVVERRGPLPEAEVVRLLRDALTILQHLHGRTPAVIHRDLKPSNIILADTGRLYLVDFGAVKEALGQPTTDPESTVIKSAGYTPPEQTRGVVVPASDLYALGATALNLATARHPFDWYDALSGQWQLAGRINVSRRLETVLGRLLEESLPRRFASASDALAALSASGPATDVTQITTQIEAPPPREGALAVGAVLRGRYEVQAVVHDDPTSTTYRVADRESFGRPCLLIELRPTAETDTQVRDEFEAAARRLTAVTHPALPRVLAYFPDGGRYYVIQEVVEGQTLADRVRTRGPLSEGEAVSVLRAALDALAVIHECSPPIVHGALQPSRLVLTGPGAVMFTDFRSFRDTLAGREGSGAAPAPASPYAPPGAAGREPEPWGDFHALGATTLFLLTGRTPTELRGSSPAPGVRPALGRVLAKMTSPAPPDRYASARQVLADLDDIGADLDAPPPVVQPITPPGPVPVPVPAPSGWFTRRNLIVAGIVAVLAIGAWGRSREPRAPDRPPTPARPAAPQPAVPAQPAQPSMPQPAPVQPPAPQPQPAQPFPTQPVQPQPAQPQPGPQDPLPRRPPPAPRVAGGSPAFLGVVGLPESLNVSGRRQPALLVRSLTNQGPAHRAGLREGDMLVSVDGHPVGGAPELLRALTGHSVNSQVRLEFYSQGQYRSSTATLINSPFPEFSEGRAADPPEGSSRFFPQADPALVQAARRTLTQADSISVPGFGYLWVRFPDGWRAQRWGRDSRQPTLIYVQGPDNLTRFDAGFLWEDVGDLSPDGAFSKTFWDNLRGDSRGAQLLGDRVVSRTVKRFWFTQQLDAGAALSEFSLQVSTNSAITFGQGTRRTFYRWRWSRIPAGDTSPRTVSLLEAMRLESGFIPAL